MPCNFYGSYGSSNYLAIENIRLNHTLLFLTPSSEWVILSTLYENLCTMAAQHITDKSFSEALILASTNPKYDKRLSSVHENYKLFMY